MAWRTHLEQAINGKHPVLGRIVVFVIYALIALSTISIGIESMPDLPSSWRVALAILEVIAVVVFTIEYVVRLILAPRKLAYVLSPGGLVDILAIAPFYLSLGVDLRALRAFRLLRVLRLLKFARYGNALERLGLALRMVREELVIFGSCAIITLYLCAIGIFYFEHDAQPMVFSSVFDSMWWAAVTLTTVGYGDMYPITFGGRLFTVLVLFVALGVIAIPTGLIGSAMSKVRGVELPEEDGGS